MPTWSSKQKYQREWKRGSSQRMKSENFSHEWASGDSLLARGWHTSGCLRLVSQMALGGRAGGQEYLRSAPTSRASASSQLPHPSLLPPVLPVSHCSPPLSSWSAFFLCLPAPFFSLSVLLPSFLRAECPPSSCKPQFPSLPNGKKNDSVCMTK